MVDQTRRKVRLGLVTGAVATICMSALVLAAPAFLGEAQPELLARAVATATAHPLWLVAALLVHLGYGSLAGALYRVAAERVSLRTGLFFALGLWGVAMTIYAPLFGLGFLASHEPALAVLLLPPHFLYGGVLGALAPRGEVIQPIETRRRAAAPWIGAPRTACSLS